MDYGRVLLRLVCGGGRGGRAHGSFKGALPGQEAGAGTPLALGVPQHVHQQPLQVFPDGGQRRDPRHDHHGRIPEALGAILVVHGIPIAALSSQVTLQDARELKFAKGQSSSQGVVEALAIHVALRVWKEKLKGQRLNLTVQSDSVTALPLTQRLSNANPRLNFLGAELGILLEELEVEKVVPRHIWGGECSSRLPLTTRQVGQRTRPQHLERAEDRRSSRTGRRLLTGGCPHPSRSRAFGGSPPSCPSTGPGTRCSEGQEHEGRPHGHVQAAVAAVKHVFGSHAQGSEGIRSGAGGGLTGRAGLVAVPQAQHSCCCATCPASPLVIATR